MGDGYTDLERTEGDNTWYLDVGILAAIRLEAIFCLTQVVS